MEEQEDGALYVSYVCETKRRRYPIVSYVLWWTRDNIQRYLERCVVSVFCKKTVSCVKENELYPEGKVVSYVSSPAVRKTKEERTSLAIIGLCI